MEVNLILAEENAELFERYARSLDLPLSVMVERVVLDHIENEYDIKLCEEAMEEFKRNPKTYTHEEVKEMCGIE